MQLTTDHIMPRQAGGDESADNKAVACYECNAIKRVYIPSGNNREERIADVRRHIEGKRNQWRERFEKMTAEMVVAEASHLAG